MTKRTIQESMPPEIERLAQRMYEQTSLAQTGNTWDWTCAGIDIQNVWRLRAFIEDYSDGQPQGDK